MDRLYKKKDPDPIKNLATVIFSSGSTGDLKGESPAVLYNGDIDIEKLTDQLKAGELPNLWIPKKDAYFKVDEIPMPGSGKLDLKKIKAVAMEMNGQS